MNYPFIIIIIIVVIIITTTTTAGKILVIFTVLTVIKNEWNVQRMCIIID